MSYLVFIQNEGEKINANSLEALVATQHMAESSNAEIYAVTFNKNVADNLSKYNLTKIILVENDQLKNFNPIYYLNTIEELYNNYSPNLICFGHTYQTRDWVPRLSARLDIPFVSDCTYFEKSDTFNFIRPIYQAKLNEKIELTNNTGIISFQAGSFNIEDIKLGNTEIKIHQANLTNISLTIRPGEKFKDSEEGVDLTSADVIVSIGRGIGKIENIPIAENLAAKLNAQIGASRPVVDAGWLDHSRQVGSSGQTVAPKLYFSVGISGAIQHLVGMKGSKNIIAINKDPNAPIFEIADYAVVGDLFEIIPKLIEEL